MNIQTEDELKKQHYKLVEEIRLIAYDVKQTSPDIGNALLKKINTMENIVETLCHKSVY